MPIRLRLTFLYGTLLGVTLLLFGSFVYIVFERNMVEEIDGSLNDRATEMIRILQQSSFSAISPRLPSINAFASGEFFIQLLDADGAVIDRSRNLGQQRVPVDLESLRRIAKSGSDFETLEADTTNLRVFTLPLVYREGPVERQQVVGYVQVARSLEELDATMRRLRQVLAVIGGMMLLAAFAIGYAFASRSLRPIHRITLTARNIGVRGNLAERVRYRGPRDEIGRLAATFNEMLDRLEEAYRRLEAALAAQRRFVADASHELRTPLTTIRGNLDLIRRHPDLTGQDKSEALADAASEAQRMSRIVEDLLFLARADAGQRLDKAPVPADELVREVVRQARLLATGQTVEVGDIRQATVLASADHLKQLLLIFVDNAVKYTPTSGTIRISTLLQGNPPFYGVEVQDTGRGISPDAMPYVFERFFRAEEGRGGEGAGLGLAIARWLADEHGGRIDVRSVQGQGSAFTIWLPALDEGEPLEATSLVAQLTASA